MFSDGKGVDLRLFVLCLFLSYSTFASNDIDFTVLDSIRPVDPPGQKWQLERAKNKKRWQWNFRKKVLLDDVKKSKIRAVMIPRGSYLYRLADDKVIYTTKNIYAFAYAKVDKDGFRYLVNSNKSKVLYRVAEINTTYIKDIVDLNSKPEKFIAYPKRVRDKKNREKVPPTKHLLAVNFAIQQSQFMSEITDNTTSNSFKINYDYYGVFNWEQKIKFGLHTSFFDHSYADSFGDKVKYRNISLGPLMTYSLSEAAKWGFSVQRSFYSFISLFDSIGVPQKLPVKSLSFSFLYQTVWNTSWANFPVGIKFTNIRNALDNNETKVSLSSQKKNDLSLGAYIGWQFEL